MRGVMGVPGGGCLDPRLPGSGVPAPRAMATTHHAVCIDMLRRHLVDAQGVVGGVSEDVHLDSKPGSERGCGCVAGLSRCMALHSWGAAFRMGLDAAATCAADPAATNAWRSAPAMKGESVRASSGNCRATR